MQHNPAASLLEFIHDIVYGQDAPRRCQWRSAVLPTHSVADFKYASAYLQETHSTAKKKGFLEPYTLELRDRTLISFIQVKGARLNIAERDIGEKATHLAMRLSSYMSIGNGLQHSFGIHFLNDPGTASTVYEQKISAMKTTAQAMGGDASHYFNDLSSRLVKGATEEMCLFVVRTHLRGLRPDEVKQADLDYLTVSKNISQHPERVKNVHTPLALETEYGQAIVPRTRILMGRHESLVTKLCEDFGSHVIGIGAQLISVREALDTVTAFADREHLRAQSWCALLGDSQLAASPLLLTHNTPAPLKLGMQVLKKKIRGYVHGSDEVAQVGSVFYGTAMLEMAPISPEEGPSQVSFDALMRKIRSKNIPCAVNYNLRPQGLKFNAFSRTMNAVLGSISANNRQLRDALSTLTRYEETAGGVDCVVGWQALFTTWAYTQKEAESALRDLKLMLQSWGSAQPITETGAPDALRLDSIPEYTASSGAMVLPAPLSHALYHSPIMRPSSPWEYGPLLFKTLDGVLYPVALGSKLQSSYVTAIVAPSGGGKSYLLNRLHTAMCLAPGQTKLPYLCLIDVGPGGDGYQRLLKTVLPKSMHYELQYYKVINSAQHCVNPFDVQLGCHAPMSMEREFIMAVLTLVLDGIGAEATRLSASLIDAAYEHFGPQSTAAKIWQSSYHKHVSQTLKDAGIDAHNKTAFQIRDDLFTAGYTREALIAQRFAMPTLQDLTGLLAVGRIKAMYQSARSDTGEPILDAAGRALSQATAEFPVIAGVTQQDMDSARCIIINLQNVTAVSTASGIRFAGMMYLYARHLGSRHFFIDKDEIKHYAAPVYQQYQQKRVAEIQSSVKVLSYDEWHNVRRVNGLVELNIKEARETRKYRVYLNFITQYFTDIPDEILDGMTSLWVVSAQSDAQNRSIVERLNISDTDYQCLSKALDTIGKMWCLFKLRDGNVTTVLKNDIGAFESWCYTTDDKDAPLRNALIDRLGETQALRLLATSFPNGTATHFLDRLAQHRLEHSPNNDQLALTELAIETILKQHAQPL